MPRRARWALLRYFAALHIDWTGEQHITDRSVVVSERARIVDPASFRKAELRASAHPIAPLSVAPRQGRTATGRDTVPFLGGGRQGGGNSEKIAGSRDSLRPELGESSLQKGAIPARMSDWKVSLARHWACRHGTQDWSHLNHLAPALEAF